MRKHTNTHTHIPISDHKEILHKPEKVNTEIPSHIQRALKERKKRISLTQTQHIFEGNYPVKRTVCGHKEPSQDKET